MSRTPGRAAGGGDRDRGQAAVEFAIALPLVAILVLGILQVVLVVRDQLAVELAAREAARAASVAASPGTAATQAAHAATTLRPLSIDTSVQGDRVTVVVAFASTTDVAMIGDVAVSAEVTMRREPP